MRTDIVYEVIDLRRNGGGTITSAPLARLGYVPNGIEVSFLNDHGMVLVLPDDDASERFEDDGARVTLHFDDGDIVLEPLTVERYMKQVRPFLKDAPIFGDEDQLQRYWYSQLVSL